MIFSGAYRNLPLFVYNGVIAGETITVQSLRQFLGFRELTHMTNYLWLAYLPVRQQMLAYEDVCQPR